MDGEHPRWYAFDWTSRSLSSEVNFLAKSDYENIRGTGVDVVNVLVAWI